MAENEQDIVVDSSGEITKLNCVMCDELISARAKKCRYCGETLDVSLRKAEEALRASKNQGNVYMNAAGGAAAGGSAAVGGTMGGVGHYTRTKSRIVAFILAWLLGGIGGHKFYLGRAGQGILYLIFFWTFIPAIIAFIEGIVYLTMNDERFWQKYG